LQPSKRKSLKEVELLSPILRKISALFVEKVFAVLGFFAQGVFRTSRAIVSHIPIWNSRSISSCSGGVALAPTQPFGKPPERERERERERGGAMRREERRALLKSSLNP
jgi:hypothetical protein